MIILARAIQTPSSPVYPSQLYLPQQPFFSFIYHHYKYLNIILTIIHINSIKLSYHTPHRHYNLSKLPLSSPPLHFISYATILSTIMIYPNPHGPPNHYKTSFHCPLHHYKLSKLPLSSPQLQFI